MDASLFLCKKPKKMQRQLHFRLVLPFSLW